MFKTTTHAVVAAVACASITSVIAGGAAVANGNRIHRFHGQLQDLSPTTEDPMDGARARVVMRAKHDGTRFRLVVRGIDRAAVGTEYGAHLHAGPCIAGDPAAALGHYNVSTSVPPVASPETEVWLDFEVNRHGVGRSTTKVPFTPLPGTRSVVIHAEATNELGAAGARLACLPVVWQ